MLIRLGDSNVNHCTMVYNTIGSLHSKCFGQRLWGTEERHTVSSGRGPQRNVQQICEAEKFSKNIPCRVDSTCFEARAHDRAYGGQRFTPQVLNALIHSPSKRIPPHPLLTDLNSFCPFGESKGIAPNLTVIHLAVSPRSGQHSFYTWPRNVLCDSG